MNPLPYYDHDGIQIYHGDCRDFAERIKDVDAVISDPPYGMSLDTNSKRFTGGANQGVVRGQGRDDWPAIHGDNKPFDPSFWLRFPRVVLWGCNHYAAALPVGTTLVWIKKDFHLFGTFLSDCELAWMKGGCGVYAYFKQFPPPSRIAETGRCVHPNQKPVALLAWCISRAKVPEGGLILDPYMGSGTTLRAAKDMGYKAVGVEIEERYCEIAARRLEQGVLEYSDVS